MITLFVLSLFFIISFAFNPWQVTVFLPIKNFILQFFLLLSGAFYLLKGKVVIPKSFIYTFLFWVWAVFHIRCFSGRDFYFFLIIPLIIPLLISYLKRENLDKIFLWMIIVGDILAIYGIFQYFGIDFSFWGHNIERNRVFGLFGNINYFSFYLIPLFVLSFTYFLTTKGFVKFFYFINTLIVFISISITFTRISYIALGFSFFYILFFYRRLLKKNWIYIIILFLILILGIYIFIGFNTIKKRIISGFHLQEGMGRRIMIWKISFTMIDLYTLLWGRGIGWFGYMFPYYQGLYAKIHNIPYPPSISFYAHNEFLQFLIELGVPGVLLFLLLIISFVKGAKKTPSPYNVISMGIVFSYIIISFSSFPLHLPHTAFLFWFFLSVPFMYDERREVSLCIFLRIFVLFFFIVIIFAFTNLYISHSYLFFKNYERVAKLNPYWGIPKVKVAISHLKKGELDKGMRELESAKRVYTDFSLFYNLGVSYLEKRKYKKALISFERAFLLTRDKKDKAQILKYMGVIYSILKEKDKAYEAFSQSIRLNPSDPETYYNLSLTYKTMGKIKKCKENLDKALKLTGKDKVLKRAILDLLKSCKVK